MMFLHFQRFVFRFFFIFKGFLFLFVCFVFVCSVLLSLFLWFERIFVSFPINSICL